MERRAFVVVLLILFVLSSAALLFANEQHDMKGPMHHGPAMGKMKCPMMMGRCPMHCMMMKDMAKKQVVPSDDGGVVVLMGDKLMKYDKNLELKKEVEIKTDAGMMMEKMDAACQGCPMCQQCKKAMGEDKGKEEPAAVEAAAQVKNSGR